MNEHFTFVSGDTIAQLGGTQTNSSSAPQVSAQVGGITINQPVDPKTGKPCAWYDVLCTLQNIPLIPGVPANPRSPGGDKMYGDPVSKAIEGAQGVPVGDGSNITDAAKGIAKFAGLIILGIVLLAIGVWAIVK